FVDTAGRRAALVGGAIVSALGTFVLGIAHATWVVVVAMAVLAAGTAFVGTAPGALVGAVARGRSGTVVAAFQMSGDLGAVIGPIVAGVFVDAGSFLMAFGVAGVVLLAAAALGLQAPPRPAPGPEVASVAGDAGSPGVAGDADKAVVREPDREDERPH
ncbi:MAG TPA: MFS transporter, partial [Actinopolymorphaceae bacterium]